MAAGYPDWTRAVRLLGIDADSNLITLRADDEGKLVIPIQGWDGAALRTVKVDEEGRLSAFITDSTDAWGQMLEVGNAELAARLGSLRVYDRRGQSVLEHDFGKGLGIFALDGDGAGHAEALDPVYWRTGGYSVKLTGGSDGDREASVAGSLPVLPSAAIAAESSWSIDTDTNYVEMDIDYYDGTLRYLCKIRYDLSLEQLVLYDEDGFWVTLEGDIKVEPAANMFNYWKLVANVTSGSYVRVLLNGIEKDISAYPIRTGAAAVAPRMVITFLNNSEPASNDVVYLDSIAASVVEPA